MQVGKWLEKSWRCTNIFATEEWMDCALLMQDHTLLGQSCSWIWNNLAGAVEATRGDSLGAADRMMAESCDSSGIVPPSARQPSDFHSRSRATNFSVSALPAAVFGSGSCACWISALRLPQPRDLWLLLLHTLLVLQASNSPELHPALYSGQAHGVCLFCAWCIIVSLIASFPIRILVFATICEWFAFLPVLFNCKVY